MKPTASSFQPLKIYLASQVECGANQSFFRFHPPQRYFHQGRNSIHLLRQTRSNTPEQRFWGAPSSNSIQKLSTAFLFFSFVFHIYCLAHQRTRLVTEPAGWRSFFMFYLYVLSTFCHRVKKIKQNTPINKRPSHVLSIFRATFSCMVICWEPPESFISTRDSTSRF